MLEQNRPLEKSPFLVKGLVYQGACTYYEKNVPGGLAAVLRTLADPALAAFLQQPFAADEKYDVLPMVQISRAAAEVAAISEQRMVGENARWMAQRDIGGFLKMILHFSSPKIVATMLPMAAHQYFDFGSAEGKLVGPSALQAAQHGVPTKLAPWMMWAVMGFAPVALELAGAKSVRVQQVGELSITGKQAGFEICTLTWRILWT